MSKALYKLLCYIRLESYKGNKSKEIKTEVMCENLWLPETRRAALLKTFIDIKTTEIIIYLFVHNI